MCILYVSFASLGLGTDYKTGFKTIRVPLTHSLYQDWNETTTTFQDLYVSLTFLRLLLTYV